MMIRKEDLNIDGSYQRDEVTKAKVMEIARDWDWKLFGTLSVIRRADKSFWIYDGGHRCRASYFRDDILELPCMVFDASDEKTEAKAFLGANLMKSNVSAFHKHRAAVVIKDPIAVAVESIITKHGYYVCDGPASYGFIAVHTLHTLVKDDAVLADRAFGVCSEIAKDGESFSGEVLSALFTCQKKLLGIADIFSDSHLDRLKNETIPGIDAAIRREKHIVGKGGAVVGAKAVLDVLKKKKKRRLSFQ